MSEREVLLFFARHRNDDVCISYETRDDGSIVTQEKARALAPAALALSLAGCAGHMGDAAETRTECFDAQGYATDCPTTSRLDMAVIPGGVDADEAALAELEAIAAQEDALTDEAAARELDTSDAVAWRAEDAAQDKLVYDDDGDATYVDASGAPRCRVSKRAVNKILYPRRGLIMGKPGPVSIAGLCEHEIVRRETERLERRERRERERAARRAQR
ncbi:MAG TPA: hypothetical protein VG755_09340 [Nannocystaceae bacterium]|nr:hypothetical protein [Nannocystaceae bacterium]